MSLQFTGRLDVNTMAFTSLNHLSLHHLYVNPSSCSETLSSSSSVPSPLSVNSLHASFAPGSSRRALLLAQPGELHRGVCGNRHSRYRSACANHLPGLRGRWCSQHGSVIRVCVNARVWVPEQEWRRLGRGEWLWKRLWEDVLVSERSIEQDWWDNILVHILASRT